VVPLVVAQQEKEETSLGEEEESLANSIVSIQKTKMPLM
jgi:hypothetical protein